MHVISIRELHTYASVPTVKGTMFKVLLYLKDSIDKEYALVRKSRHTAIGLDEYDRILYHQSGLEINLFNYDNCCWLRTDNGDGNQEAKVISFNSNEQAKYFLLSDEEYIK